MRGYFFRKIMQNQKNISPNQNYVNAFEKQQQELLKRAIKSRCNAQAPYSKYLVGAAVLSERGGIYSGCNVERCSYTQTTHAEQNAVDTMIAQEGSVKIIAMAIAAGPADAELAFPETVNVSQEIKAGVCGHCLQIIWENCFDDPNIPIVVLSAHGSLASVTIGDLLPMPFGPSDLGINYQNNI